VTEILLRHSEDDAWCQPSGRDYEDEAHLQQLLADHPSLIPGVGLHAKACREFQLEVGPSDIVVVDSSGRITLVECKLAKNPEVRREIVGQLFDYAGRLWKMTVEDFDRRWIAKTGASVFEGEGYSSPEFLESFAENLSGGTFTLVLAVDAINPSLRRMVEYVNKTTGPETAVIAVEYTRYSEGKFEVLIPKTYGQDSADDKKSQLGELRQKWKMTDVAAHLSANQPDAFEPFTYLSNALLDMGMEFKSGHGVMPSGIFTCVAENGVELKPLHVATTSGALLELNFDAWATSWIREGGASESLDLLKHGWFEIPELEGAMAPILETSSRRRSIYLHNLTPRATEELVLALEKFLSRAQG
jgi:hypothetical protein